MKDAKEILTDLVAFPVLGGQSNLTIANYIESYLAEFDVVVNRVPNHDETKASLHCRIGPAGSDGVILSGHMDVVPVEGQDWHTDPFVLTEMDGSLYGRGSCDMKGFLACCLANVPKMVGANLKRPIYLAFSYDEEIGCMGAHDLIKAINTLYDEKPRFAIIGEPSMMKPIIGQKGICIYETTVNGSAGHSSRIRQEVSAVHESARLVLWLEDKMNRLVSEGRVDTRFHPPHTSIHCGVFKGGIAPNVIADRCSFQWDVRNIPMDQIESIKNDYDRYCDARIEELRKIFPDFTIVTSEDHLPVPPLDTQEGDDIVRLVREISGNNEVGTVAYAAEAGQFSAGGFESIICGPGSIEQAHRANEYISLDQLEQGEAMVSRLVDKFSE